VTMFEKGRHWAYKAIRDYMHHNSSYEWEKAVRAQIEAINSSFEQPLPYGEVKATAKSIAKWVWQRFSYGDFSEIQAKRGAKGGKAKGQAYVEKKAEALALLEQGLSQVEIAAKVEISTRTLRNWKSGK
jgi:DNA-binding NarL/FixJ family response regulator